MGILCLFMSGRFNYSRRVLLAEALLVGISVISTLLFGWLQEIEEYYLRMVSLGTLVVIDISVCVAIMVTVEMQGGIIAFFMFKSILLMLAVEASFGSVVLPAIIFYFFFKIVATVLEKVNKLDEVDYRQLEQRTKFIGNQQKRRNINSVLLLICVLLIVFFSLSKQAHQHVPFLISFIPFLGVAVELYIMSKSVDLKFKLISTWLSYNLYFFLGIQALLGKLYHNSYIYFTLPSIVYLTVYFFFARICIGSRSSKFHPTDIMFFQATYIFKGDKCHKFYRQNSNAQRTLRVIDRLSRQLAVIIYFLSFIAAVQFNSYIHLLGSIYLMNNFTLQNDNPIRMIAYLQEKLDFSISVRPKLTIPIGVLIYLVLTKQTSRKQYLFDEMNHCSDIAHLQIAFLGILMIATFMSQFTDKMKPSILKMVGLACPLIVIAWVIWIQCIHLKIIILGLYVLTYCLEAIGSTSKSLHKGTKTN